MAEEGQANQVIHVKTVEAWKEHFEKGKDSKKLVVADFTASWCGPCRFIAPYFAELAAKTPEAVFLKVDVDELKPIAEEWNIEAMPTLLLLKEGQVVHKIVGAMKEELQQKVEEHKAPVVATT